MPIIEVIVDEISEFLNLSHEEVYQRIEGEIFDPGINVARAWKQANPTTEEEILNFYRTTDAYLFDLYIDHERAFRKKVLERVLFRLRNHNAKMVLDYGGGLGFDAIAMREASMDVTYFELKGLTSEFAEQRFKKKGYNDIKVINDTSSLLRNSFDAIVCIEVLEHIPQPIKVIELFSNLIKENGIILLTESFGTFSEDYPSHLKANLKYAGKIFNLMEKYNFICTYRYSDNAPLEFKKMKRGMTFIIFKIKWQLMELIALIKRAKNIIRRII